MSNQPLPRAKNLAPNRMQEASFRRNEFRALIEPGTKPEDLEAPEYWSHHSLVLTQFDKIEAVAEDGSWYAEFLVLSVGKDRERYAKVKRIAYINLHEDMEGEEAATPGTPGQAKYYTKYCGPAARWCVLRNSDQEVIHRGLQTKEEATGKLNKLVESLAA